MSTAQRSFLYGVLAALAAVLAGPVSTAMALLPPSVVFVSPSSGSTAGGTAVTITGAGFVTSVTPTVTIGSAASEVVVHSETEITATTSAGSAGPVEVVVSNENGTSVLGPSYTYVAPPPPACSAVPSVAGQPGNQVVTAPAEASFTVTEGAIPANCSAATIQWQVSTNGSTWNNVSASNVSGGTSGTLSISPTSTSESGDEYRAVLTNAAGSSESNAATLTVNRPPCSAAPSITEQPVSQTVTAPSEASFMVAGSTPENCDAPTVQWYSEAPGGPSFSPIGGATSASYTTPPTSTAESGTKFEAIFTNAHGETTSKEVTLTVNAPACSAVPSVAGQPGNQVVTAPAEASFTVTEGAIPANCSAATIQWQVSTNGSTWNNVSASNVSGGTSGTLSISPTSTSESGDEYRAVLTNAAGSRESNAATLTVNAPACSAAPSITKQPKSQTVTAPSEASFTAAGSTPENCGAPTVRWYSEAPGGSSFSPIGGATSASYTTPPTSTVESGTKFEAIFTNAHGETTSNQVTLTVNPPPCSAAPSITKQPASQTVTAPGEASFTAAGSTPENCAAPTVQWYSKAPGGSSFSPIGGATSASYTTPPTSTAESGTKFEAIFTNSAGSSESSVATLTVNPPPRPTVTLNAPISPSNDATPSFTGKASNTTQVVVHIYNSTHTEVSSATAGTGGNWTSNQATPALPSGDYTADATQEGSFGAAEGISNSVAFTVDTASPTVTLNQPASPSNNTRPPFSGSASDSTQVTVKIYEGPKGEGSVLAKATATPRNGKWSSLALNPPLSNGKHVYTAIATQTSSLGNPEGVSNQATFTVDTNAPTVTLDQPAPRSNDATPSFTGSASDTTPISIYIYAGAKVTGKSLSKATATSSGGNWISGDATPALPNGKHTYTAVAIQKSSLGNPDGSSSPETFTVDTDAPTVTLNAPPTWTNDATPSFTGTASETSSVMVQIYAGSTSDGAPVTTATATGTGGSWISGPVSEPLPDGQYTALAIQESRFGNHVGGTKGIPFMVDTVPPRVNLTYPSNGSSNAGESQLVKGTAGTVAGDLPGVTVQLFLGSVITAGQTPLQSILVNPVEGAWSATFAGLSPGSYTTRAEQSDDAGNVGVSASSTFTITGPPPSPATPPAFGPPVASFSVSPAAPHTGETVSLLSSSTDAASPITAFAWDPAGNGAFTPGGPVISTSFSTPGRHLVQLSVTDANGLSSVASEAIEVSAPLPELMQPFPVVQISATRGSSGVKLKLLSVRAPAGARITVACSGHGCPVKSQSRTAAAGKVGAAPLAFRKFERSLRAGVILEIRISKPGVIGKYTRFVVRRGKLPTRTDSCLAPTGVKPIACPSS